ncbi:hypothetical protein CH363_09870 [Leptospira haakeii]|uniref:Uncharacterized protein n=1 Tax=Leptospira haakeii TaxID=2023198 RepID=A0ABX4PLC7_9LEPT|nr:hypothetical protein CH363_09870 [Leptospira haakeii]PKA18096.1 hypothetical protein CH377_19385 [Leptospira haakeii]
MLRTSRSGYATFASVTSFAEQTRAVANVGAPWSLSEHFSQNLFFCLFWNSRFSLYRFKRFVAC